MSTGRRTLRPHRNRMRTRSGNSLSPLAMCALPRSADASACLHRQAHLQQALHIPKVYTGLWARDDACIALPETAQSERQDCAGSYACTCVSIVYVRGSAIWAPIALPQLQALRNLSDMLSRTICPLTHAHRPSPDVHSLFVFLTLVFLLFAGSQ
jgi:hypothetical protein